MNSVILIGRLARDPELKYSPNGVAIGRFTLAVDRPRSGDEKKQADFIDCVCFKKTAEAVANNLQKGRLVAVNGRLQVRQYETQDGQKRKAAEVVCNEVRFLDKPKQGQQREESSEDMDFPDDSVPF